ncbi:MAG TPA: tRNA pseudouridine(38-40) synthase TruA, partial [Oligoflexia bacterium]|nr:tRNA pseudouridine(38-40) synthase TruA [Oligoflexia bacterium]
RVSVFSSGRTDAGVHARVQAVHTNLPEKWEHTEALQSALNSLLPSDIRILKAEIMPDHFHALRDAKKKMYVYFINPQPVQNPVLARYSWHLRFPLDWNAMAQAGQAFVGRHDFKAFAAADHSAKTTVRTIESFEWGTLVVPGFGGNTGLGYFKVVGQGFLKNMVRIMVGSLVRVGAGKAPVDSIARALISGQRNQAGSTAPPHGLWLWDVLY